jgi:hypothetical protein
MRRLVVGQGAVAVLACLAAIAVLYGFSGVRWAPLALVAALYAWGLPDRREGLD